MLLKQLIDRSVLRRMSLLILPAAFTGSMHGLIALEGPPSRKNEAKPQAWIDAAFDKTMILFHHIV
jgi:hypothetical protein